MLDALLVSDQHIPESLFGATLLLQGGLGFPMNDPVSGTLAATKRGRSTSALSTLSDYQGLRGGSNQTIAIGDFGLAIGWTMKRNDASSLLSGKERATCAVRLLKEQRQRSLQKDRTDQEMRWLANNRHRFSGQWIAVLGETLLATGNTAKEVFARVADQAIPPLVIRVEDEEPPFAGW
jgi:hypothetical protein